MTSSRRSGRAVDFEIFRADLDDGARLQDRAAGRATAFRPRHDVQDPGHPGREQPLGRARRVPDQRPAVLHAVPGPGPVGPNARRPHDLAVPGEAHQGGRDPGIVRAVRRRAQSCRLHRHVGPDHRRQPGGRPQAAQHRRREEGHQGGPRSRGLEGPSWQAPSEGSGRTLDGEVQQGQGSGRRLEATRRHRHPHLRLPEPYRDRPGLRADSDMDGDRCGGL